MSIEESLTRHAMALERMADVLEELIRAKLSVKANKLMPAKPKTDKPGPGRPRKKTPGKMVPSGLPAPSYDKSEMLQHIRETVEASLPATDQPPVTEIPSGNWRGPIRYETVRAAVFQVKDTKGITAVMEILGSFGVKSATELKPEQWKDCIAACKAASSPALDPIA